ncbi:hypothetical protein K523DRAFT_356856 [Schizophyllum commune Tattone D]|nr:hypothetical protein K523DRAFT_356856 [Schizophyllum commune Tattone D]
MDKDIGDANPSSTALDESTSLPLTKEVVAVEEAIARAKAGCERIHGLDAIASGVQAHALPTRLEHWEVNVTLKAVGRATRDDIAHLCQRQQAPKGAQDAKDVPPAPIPHTIVEREPEVAPLSDADLAATRDDGGFDDRPEDSLPSLDISELREDQERAYRIIRWHLVEVGKQTPSGTPGDIFGGINVVIVGDTHQFPLVGGSAANRLYYPVSPTDTALMYEGRQIYESFRPVVILREQMRVREAVWLSFPKRPRQGRVPPSDLEMLSTLVLSNPACPPTDFAQKPWKDASLVTLRHAVRDEWNDAAVRQHCGLAEAQLFVCSAEDRANHRPLSLSERMWMVQRKKNGRTKKDLPETLALAIDAKVLVARNLATDLEVTNGARGVIVDIVLDPDEPDTPSGSVVHLKYLPQYVLVKLDRTQAGKLEGLEEGVIPITPIELSRQIAGETIALKGRRLLP